MKDLPLNANHHNRHDEGTQVFNAIIHSPKQGLERLQKLDLELVPSVKPGKEFRTVMPDQPLVGFKRDEDDETERVTVSKLKTEVLTRHNDHFLVYGNTNDEHTLQPDSKILGFSDEEPDNYPDFVSEKVDGEQLIASVRGNTADILFFTAFNIEARVENDMADQNLNFDRLKNSMADVYTQYSMSRGGTSEDNAQSGSISVKVDQEVPYSAMRFDENTFVDGMIPFHFFAGVLDQYFMRIGWTNPRLVLRYIGRDGRVGAFDGEWGRLASTSSRRQYGFGIELDGAFYDPKIIGLDKPPNHADLLKMPVVFDKIQTTELPVNHLVSDIGGTSGGYYETYRHNPGAHSVISKTPGADFPGLHAGYVIDGKPEDMTNFWTEGTQDDIGDVLIKRDLSVSNKIIEEETLGTKYPRRVLGFAQDFDQKPPIHTALKSHFKFKVKTDPGPMPHFPLRCSLLVREKPLDPSQAVDLIATTQSLGVERTIKVFLDNISDLVIDVVATIVLTLVTEGGYIECATMDFAGDITTAIFNTTIGMMESEFVDPYIPHKEQFKQYVIFSSQVSYDGYEYVPGTGVKTHLNSIYSHFTSDKVKNLKNWGMKIDKVAETVAICGLLKAPFAHLKAAIKNSFTPEDLGGLGAATAMGMKSMGIVIPRNARRQGKGEVFNFQYNVSKKIDIFPPKHSMVSAFTTSAPALKGLGINLGQWQEFGRDSTLVSDADVVAHLIEATEDPALEATALQILVEMGVGNIRRYPKSDYSGYYEDYKMRIGRVPTMAAVIVPGGRIKGGQTAGDFEFTFGVTEIPVSVGAETIVFRTNQNAGARAVVQSNGYELYLIDAMIPSEASAP